MNSGKVIFRYVLLAVIWTVLMLTIIPVIRMMRINSKFDEAEKELASGRASQSLAVLKQVEMWASMFPDLNVRLGYIRARCYGSMKDLNMTEKTAKEMIERYRAGMRAPINLPETLQLIPNFAINFVLSKSESGKGITQYSGYEYLLNELKMSLQFDRMEFAADDLVKYDPNNEFGKKAREFARIRALQTKNGFPTGDASWSASASNDTKVAATSKGWEHSDQARRHILAKRWDEALKEIDLALAENPNDPALLAIKKTATMRDFKWGVVKIEGTKSYDAQGNFIQLIEPGTLLEIVSSKQSGSGEVMICKSTDGKGQILVLSKNLDVRPGPLNLANEREKALRIHLAQVNAELDKQTSGITSTRLKENPHWAEFEKAEAAFSAFKKTVRDLQKQRDAATGAERSELIDKARAMITEGTQLKAARDSAKKKFDEWQNQHPINLGINPKIETLTKELADVQQQLNSLEKGQ